MKGGMILFAVVHRCHKGLILKEITILNGFCDSCQILIYDPAGSHIQVSDLGVTHLSLREAYGKSAGIPLHKRILLHQAVHFRSFCFIYCISFMAVIQPISIEDH